MVKISQFDFVVMVEKIIFLSTFFVIKYFRFLTNPPLKIKVVSSPQPFWKFGRRFNPPCRKRRWGGGGAHYGSGATQAVALDISKAFKFFTSLSLMEFQVSYLALFLFYSVIGIFRWFWMGSLHKNIQLMLEFLKGPFLVLHFSYYTLKVVPVTFLLVCFLCLKESTCETRKNVFYFTSKTLFVPEIIKF